MKRTAGRRDRPARDGLAVLVAAGCLAACRVPPPKSQFPTADDALGRMKDAFVCANGVQGKGKIDVRSPDQGRVRGEVSVFAINAARVRIDVLNPFGGMLYTLTSNGRDFQMLDFQKSEFLHGSASPCNLARLTRVPVPGHVLVTLLRGEAPLLVHDAGASTIAWDAGDGYYRIAIPSRHDAHEEVRLAVHPDDFDKPWNEQRVRVVGVTTTHKDVILYDADIRNHEPSHTAPPRVDPDGLDDDIPPSGGLCDIEVPRSIRIEIPNTEDDVIFQYKSVDLNPPIPESAFYQPVAAGTQVVLVQCDDGP